MSRLYFFFYSRVCVCVSFFLFGFPFQTQSRERHLTVNKQFKHKIETLGLDFVARGRRALRAGQLKMT